MTGQSGAETALPSASTTRWRPTSIRYAGRKSGLQQPLKISPHVVVPDAVTTAGAFPRRLIFRRSWECLASAWNDDLKRIGCSFGGEILLEKIVTDPACTHHRIGGRFEFVSLPKTSTAMAYASGGRPDPPSRSARYHQEVAGALGPAERVAGENAFQCRAHCLQRRQAWWAANVEPLRRIGRRSII